MNKQELIQRKAEKIQAELCDGGIVFNTEHVVLHDGARDVVSNYTFDDVVLCAAEDFELNEELRKLYSDGENSRFTDSIDKALDKVSLKLAEQWFEGSK